MRLPPPVTRNHDPESHVSLIFKCISLSSLTHTHSLSHPLIMRNVIMSCVLSLCACLLQPAKVGSRVACEPLTHLTNSWNWKRNSTSTNTCVGPDESKSRRVSHMSRPWIQAVIPFSFLLTALELTERQVKVWFQVRGHRDR